MMAKVDTVSPGSRSHIFATTQALFILSTSQDDQKHTVSSLKLLREVVTHLIGWLGHYIPYTYVNIEILSGRYIFHRWSALAKLKVVKYSYSMRFWFLHYPNFNFNVQCTVFFFVYLNFILQHKSA